MEARVRPIARAPHESMLDLIEMDVVHVSREIILVADAAAREV